VVLNAFTEVVNRLSKVENYSVSIEIKKRQVERLEASVETANRLFQNAQTEYIDVLFAQRDLWDARADLIETKQAQLSAVINTYQALGGGWWEYGHSWKGPAVPPLPHDVVGSIAAAMPAPALPPPAPNDPAKPRPQPADSKTSQPEPAGNLPPGPNDLAKPRPQPADPRTSQPRPAGNLPPALP
jgi:hypothetical protein